jgi:hypothetical protein
MCMPHTRYACACHTLDMHVHAQCVAWHSQSDGKVGRMHAAHVHTRLLIVDVRANVPWLVHLALSHDA